MTPQNQQQGQIQSVGGTDTVRDQDKIMLVLAYLGIFALIPLLTVKDSDYVKWHAKQGLVYGVGGGIAFAIASTILGFIPFLGWFISCFGGLAFLGFDLYVMFMKALKGERYRIPVVADVADKL
jgi:fumarate reductase subunit D